MFAVKKFGPHVTATIPRNCSPRTRDILIHAVESFGFLVPHQESMTGPQFAVAITRYSTDEKATAVASVVEKH